MALADNCVAVSQRGVVFLRDQDVTPIQMREFMERVTDLAGCVCSIISEIYPISFQPDQFGY